MTTTDPSGNELTISFTTVVFPDPVPPAIPMMYIYSVFCVWVQVKDIRANILFILKKNGVAIVNNSLWW